MPGLTFVTFLLLAWPLALYSTEGGIIMNLGPLSVGLMNKLFFKAELKRNENIGKELDPRLLIWSASIISNSHISGELDKVNTALEISHVVVILENEIVNKRCEAGEEVCCKVSDLLFLQGIA